MGSLLLLVFLCCSRAAGQPPDLKALYDAHDWFALREAVRANPDAPAIFRVAVAAAFRQDEEVRKAVRDFGVPRPGAWEAAEVKRFLDDVNSRSGAVHRRVGEPRPSRIRYSFKRASLHIPLTINGRDVEYIFDTGATMSVVSESEARRLGLKLTRTEDSTVDANGTAIPFRYIGLARRVKIGATELRNVVFLVFRDDTHFFRGRPPGENGVLGLPAIQALGRVRWDEEGNLDVGCPAPAQPAAGPNLAFFGSRLVAQLGFEDQRLFFQLDTGASGTSLYLPFRKRFASLVDASAKKEKRTGGGAAGVAEYDAMILPKVDLRIAGVSAPLESAEISLQENLGSGLHGNLGLDLLHLARLVTLDFEAMTLTLEGRRADARLQQLVEAKQWDKLREAVAAGPASPYYRGIAACAFNQTAECEAHLRTAIRIAPDDQRVGDSLAALAFHYGRRGQVRHAAEQIRQLSGLSPGDRELRNSLADLQPFARDREQWVARSAPSKVAFRPDRLSVPVAVNGRAAEFALAFDTAPSTIGEQEAKRLGLTLRPIQGDWSGAKAAAVARRLRIGEVELRNVAFLVYGDAGRKGRLGFPVLLALGTIRKTGETELEIGLPSASGQAPNLHFDGYSIGPFAEDVFRRPGPVTLDLGAMTLRAGR